MMIYRSVLFLFFVLFVSSCKTSTPTTDVSDSGALDEVVRDQTYPVTLDGTVRGEDIHVVELSRKPFKKISVQFELAQPSDKNAPAQLTIVGMADRESRAGLFRISMSDEDCDGSYFPKILYYYEKSVFTEAYWKEPIYWGRVTELVLEKTGEGYQISVGGHDKKIELARAPAYFKFEAYSGIVIVKEVVFND